MTETKLVFPDETEAKDALQRLEEFATLQTCPFFQGHCDRLCRMFLPGKIVKDANGYLVRPPECLLRLVAERLYAKL